MMTRRTALLFTGALAGLTLAGGAVAQTKYPDQAVKIVVALPAGGGVDAMARALGQKLNTIYGQPFMVDNRPGGSGQIGMPLVAKAAPDGYTLTIAPAGLLATNKSIFKSLAYDPEADHTPRQSADGGDRQGQGEIPHHGGLSGSRKGQSGKNHLRVIG